MAEHHPEPDAPPPPYDEEARVDDIAAGRPAHPSDAFEADASDLLSSTHMAAGDAVAEDDDGGGGGDGTSEELDPDLGELAAAAGQSDTFVPIAPVELFPRTGPFILDMLGQYLVVPLLVMPILLLVGSMAHGASPRPFEALMYTAMLAYGATEVVAGQTPGKLMVDMRVRRLDGSRASRARLVARWVIRGSPELIFGLTFPARLMLDPTNPRTERVTDAIHYAAWGAGTVVFLGFFVAMFTRGQALHDLLTGTAVYREIDMVRRPGVVAQKGRAFEVRNVG